VFFKLSEKIYLLYKTFLWMFNLTIKYKQTSEKFKLIILLSFSKIEVQSFIRIFL